MYAVTDDSSSAMASKVKVRPDSYYVDESRKCLQQALEEAKQKGLSLEETRFNLHRAYCFKLPRAGKEYKIWRKELLAIEASLGVPYRFHKDSKAAQSKTAIKVLLTQADIDKAEPRTKQEAANFLRRRCKAALFMLEDSDQLRVTLKATDILENPIKWEYRAELLCDDAADYDEAFISAAHAAWTVWSELESTKL